MEIRACAPTQVPEWIAFLDAAFGYSPPQSYGIDFAPLLEPEILQYSRLLSVEGRIVASAVLHPVAAVTAAGRLRMGVVGAVATGEACRGRGYSTRVLVEQEKIAAGLGLDALILWSDKAEFYTKLGFRAAGAQEIFSLDGLPDSGGGAAGGSGAGARAGGAAREGWTANAVRSLYDLHRLRVDRSGRYWDALAKITSCRRREWSGSDGQVRAYLGFHRGRDMQNIIHEWGGEPRALVALARATLDENPGLLWMTHPALDDPIRALLPRGEAPVLSGHLALVKPLRSLAPGALDTLWFWGLDSL